MFHRRWTIATWAVALAIAATCPPLPVQAGTGPVISLPVAGVKPKSGLSLTIDCQGVDGNGYRPVRIEVRPLNGKPFPADRQLRIVLSPLSYTHQNSPRVSQIVELPEGATVVKASMAMPQAGMWYGLSIETYEDGEELRDLTNPNMGWTTVNSWDWTEARPSMLLIDSQTPRRSVRESQIQGFRYQGIEPGPTYDLPDFRSLMSLFPDPSRGGTSPTPAGSGKLSDVALLTQAAELTRLNVLPPNELPTRWIELSQYDVAVVSLADLRAMKTSHAAEVKALSDWAAGGPMLIVYGVGVDFAGLDEVEKLLAISPLPVDPDDAMFRGWTPADNARHLESLTANLQEVDGVYSPGVRYRGRPQVYYDKMADSDVKLAEPTGTPLPKPAQAPFAIRSIGLGKVVAIAADQPFSGSDTDWIWIFNSVPRNHWMWYQRNGFSLHRKNDDYWTFLIPGVGQAPVLSFVLLVSLFAVLIGPVNYMFLNRAKRLYLLLLTVPIGAVLVTGGLFSYALVTDGLGVRLRARSFTDLDQRTGRAALWSRQSYYAALAPSRGLQFPEDTTVFPLVYEPDRGSGGGMSQRMLIWDEGQTLRSGYLASRTTTQYVVLRTTTTKAQLAVRTSAAGKPPEVTNRLGAAIHYVLLRDAAGNYWQGERIAGEAMAVLTATDPKVAAARLQKFYDAGRPGAVPLGFDPNEHHVWNWSEGRYYGYSADSNISEPLMAASLLESNLILASRPTLHPPEKGTYVAIVESSPVVPYGVPRVREEASLHVIRGKY